MSVIEGMIEGPHVDGRVLPRLADGTAPDYLYRIMSIAEWDEAREQGYLSSREGRIHADIEPHFQYAEPGDNNVLVRIAYRDEDGWRAKWSSMGCLAITDSVPTDRVTEIARGGFAALEAAPLRESVETMDAWSGARLRVHRNPPLAAFQNMVEKCDVLRGILSDDGETVWLWNAHQAIHTNVSQELGIPGSYACIFYNRGRWDGPVMGRDGEYAPALARLTPELVAARKARQKKETDDLIAQLMADDDMGLLAESTTKDGRKIDVRHELNTDMTDPDMDDEPYWSVFASVDGVTVGSGWFHEDHFGGVHVNDDFRRQGIATAMYDYMVGLGYDVRPDTNGQEPDGEAFWNDRKARRTVDEGYLDSGRAPLYHWTNPENARYILEAGKFHASLFGVGKVCVTRDPNLHFNKNVVRIELDGDKVRHNTRVTPHDYIGKGKMSWSTAQPRDEREEQIHGDVSISAIRSITLFDNGFIFTSPHWIKQTKLFIALAKEKGIPLTVEKSPHPVNESAQVDATGVTVSGRELLSRYGGEVMDYAVLPDLYKQSITQWMVVEGENEEYQEQSYGVVEVPMKDIMQIIYDQLGEGQTFEEFWGDGTAGYGEAYSQRWPIIWSDGWEDGMHRLTTYRSRGETMVPVAVVV